MKSCLVKLVDDTAGLGDVIVIMPYLDKFREHNGFEIFFQVKTYKWGDLFKNTFPEIKFVSKKEEIKCDKTIDLTYINPTLPLQQIFASQLGFINAEYLRPKVDETVCDRPIKNKYVCISTHSTAQLKFWNHPNGKSDHQFSTNWNDLCIMLRKSGYTPVCVDYHLDFGKPPYYNYVPIKSVRKLGLGLDEVMKFIEHCEFFIGLSSGLTWLAHAMGKPVCMISNFTEDWHEIDLSTTDYIRITNKNVCHGCCNLAGKEFKFDSSDWYWCPKHKDTERQFECHKEIKPEMVFEKLKKWVT
jgi:autotransporter strand-loop-strand O-heptosyltransferase